VWYRLSASRRTASSTSSSREHQPANAQPSRVYAEVDLARALVEPYPFVFVQKDGTARELHQSERQYLETPFHPADGGRPSVKSNYEQKNGWGNTEGFLERVNLPSHVQIRPAPSENPSKPITKEALKQLMLDHGFEITESTPGSLSARRPRQDSKPKQ
jgi:hypothetical protein